MGRQKCGQKSESGQAVTENSGCRCMDCCNSGGGQIYYTGDFRTFGCDNQQSVPCIGCFHQLHDYLCVSLVFIGDGDTISGQIYCRKFGRQRKDRRNSGAFNTIGSIIGTFLPTFVTIPVVRTSITFLIFSGILLILGLLYFIAGRKNLIGCIAASVLFILCSIFGHSGSFAFWEQELAYEGESVYNYLQVKEMGNSVVLSTNMLFGVQSILMKDDSLSGMYYDYALAAPLMTDMASAQEDGAMDILILGMGTGTYARQCMRYFDNVSVEGVEIDSHITELACQYFELPETMKVTAYDGRAYLQSINRKYDVIMVDAYQDITIPFQMSSIEFFTLVKEHLTEDGVMVVNMNMHSDKDGNINDYLADTAANIFSEMYVIDVPGYTNRELFASNNPDSLQNLETNCLNVGEEELKDLMVSVSQKLTVYEKGDYLLTDDQAPVELLGMQVIDELISDELGYYKKYLKRRD